MSDGMKGIMKRTNYKAMVERIVLKKLQRAKLERPCDCGIPPKTLREYFGIEKSVMEIILGSLKKRGLVRFMSFKVYLTSDGIKAVGK